MEDQSNNVNDTTSDNVKQQPQAIESQKEESQQVSGAGVVDRSAMQNIYPQVSTAHTSNSQVVNQSIDKQIEENYREASSSFIEYLILVLGFSSATLYIVFASIFKNINFTNILVAALALGAIAGAIIQYKNSKKTSPLIIIGISAATYILIIVANYYVSLWFIKSSFRGVF